MPTGLAGLWLSWRYASETTRARSRAVDLPGQLAAIGALGALVGAITEGGALGWGHLVLPVNLLAPRLAECIGPCTTIVVGACVSALGCLGLLWIAADTSYWMICAQMIAISGGLGLLVPPLTSTLLGSVEKARSGIAAGVLNATRQTGSVLGVALFGSLIAGAGAFMEGLHLSLAISAAVLLLAAGAIGRGARMNNVSEHTHFPFTIPGTGL